MKNLIKLLFLLLLTSSIFALSGCSSGGDDDGDSGSVSDNNGDSNSGNSNDNYAGMTANVSGAETLQAMDEAVTEVSSSSLNQIGLSAATAANGRQLFTYQKASPTSMQGNNLEAANTDEDSSASNLLAIDSEGNSALALESNYPIKVMFSVTDPEGDYVYVALDTGWWGNTYDYSDDNDYSQVIANENCAIFKVSTDDNSIACVAEGLFVQDTNDDYWQTISGNQKPLQFDDDGNLFFTASTFETSCDEWYCWINNENWIAILYSVDPVSGSLNQITQDSDYVEFYVALGDGNLVFNTSNYDTGESGLKFWRKDTGGLVNLSGDGWGVEFFTTDTEDTAMWGSWHEDGVRFARVREQGGVYKASLSTELFQEYSSNGGWKSPDPLRVMVGDDGRLYGAFEGGRDVYDENGEWDNWINTLTVYQILPYDPVPKVELDLGDEYWWDWMEGTTFQVAKGYLFYVEEWESPFYGELDKIRMVRLHDRETTSIFDYSNDDLDAGASRMTVYTWRLSGDILYFSALDNKDNKLYQGEIDVVKLKAGASEEDYLTLTAAASALGASASIRDIEVVKPQQVEYDSNYPVVTEFHTEKENLYSASIDFSKYMDVDSVAENLSFRDHYEADIEYMPVWIYKSLHLIPDTNGLGEGDTEPLAGGSSYSLSLAANTADTSGFLTTQVFDSNFITKPDHGWYLSTTGSSSAELSSGNAGYFAGVDDDDNYNWYQSTYNLGVDASGHVRLEFSARNFDYSGVDIIMWNPHRYSEYFSEHYSDYTYEGIETNMYMDSWYSSMEYREEYYVTNWISSSHNLGLYDGTWQRYRVDWFDTNIVVSFSEDGATWNQVAYIDSARNRSDTLSERHQILLQVREPLAIDNISVTTLNISGEVANSEGDLLQVDFEENGNSLSLGDEANGDDQGLDDNLATDSDYGGDIGNW